MKELRAIAKERGIKRYYRLRKAELIELLDTQTPPTDAPTTIMDEPVPDLVNKAIKKFADWLINYIPEPIRRTVNKGVEKLKKEIKEILEKKRNFPNKK